MLRLISNREAILYEGAMMCIRFTKQAAEQVRWQPFEGQIAAHDGQITTTEGNNLIPACKSRRAGGCRSTARCTGSPRKRERTATTARRGRGAADRRRAPSRGALASA